MAKWENEYNALTPEQKAGLVGWKQGVMNWYMYSPYDDYSVIKTPKVIDGVPLYDNAEDAYASLNLTVPASRKIGIFNVNANPGGEVTYTENEQSINVQRQESPKEQTFRVNVPPRPPVANVPQPVKRHSYLEGIPEENLSQFGI